MVQGVDGALVGFASLVPGLINDLLEAVKEGDLKKAMAIQARIDPLKDAVYGAGEPTGEAHGRMKAAMAALGIIRDADGAAADAQTLKRRNGTDSRRGQGGWSGTASSGLSVVGAAAAASGAQQSKLTTICDNATK